MTNLTDEQKKSIWVRLGALVGFSDKADVKLADYVAKDGSTISIDEATSEVTSGQADGEYEMEDGATLVITDGKLAEIKPASTEEVQVEEVAAADEVPVEEAPADDKQAKIDELTAENEALKAEVEALKAANSDKETKLSALDAAPADKKVKLAAVISTTLTPAQAAWARYNQK